MVADRSVSYKKDQGDRDERMRGVEFRGGEDVHRRELQVAQLL